MHWISVRFYEMGDSLKKLVEKCLLIREIGVKVKHSFFFYNSQQHSNQYFCINPLDDFLGRFLSCDLLKQIIFFSTYGSVHPNTIYGLQSMKAIGKTFVGSYVLSSP